MTTENTLTNEQSCENYLSSIIGRVDGYCLDRDRCVNYYPTVFHRLIYPNS
jgi:hypothetical protein